MSEYSDVSQSREFAAEALGGARIASVVDPASSIPQWLDASGAERIELWAERDRLTAHSAREATLHAHAIIIDLDLGVARAFRLATMISPPCGVLFIAESIDAATCREIRQVHWGYRSKHASQGDFLLALRRLVRLCVPDLARLAAHGVQMWRLSPQQARVLHYNLWSYCDRDIAAALAVSVHTVQEYQEDLRKKTGARNKQAYLARLLEVSGVPQSAPESRRVRATPGLAAARVEWTTNAEVEPMRLEGRVANG
jgi:DNA-binding NarL/FixJ family response regulator